MKKFYWLLSALLVLGLLLSACGPAEEAVVEEAVEEAVAEEAAEEAAEGGWCSNTDIVFFPGGSPGGPFATVVYNGAVQAAEDLGANMETVWSDWNPENMITQFSEAVATGPDGIAVRGGLDRAGAHFFY